MQDPLIATEDRAHYGPTPGTADVCRWHRHALDGYWIAACNEAFALNDGGPLDHRFSFCPYCGRRLHIDHHSTEEPTP